MIVCVDIFLCVPFQVDVAWFYRNCLTDTCNCNRGGDCECLCTSIAAYAYKCCQQGVTIHWRSPSVCREYIHTQTDKYNTGFCCVGQGRDLCLPLWPIFCSHSLHQSIFLPFFIRLNNSSVISYILLFWTVFQLMIASTTIKVCLTENLLPDL